MSEAPNQPKRRRRPRNPGSVSVAQRVLWGAILAAEAELKGAQDAETVLRCAHCIQQATSSYVRLLETADLAERVSALEQRLNTGTLRRVG